MYSHAPPEYDCPFCRIVRGEFGKGVLSQPDDLVYQDEFVTAFVAAKQWPNNLGHCLILPNHHHENLYDLPLALATKIHELSRAVALAMKTAYSCEGISTRQHNEPAGNQDVWHYHLHVFPRYADDRLYTSPRGDLAPEIRAVYARRLRAALGDWNPEQ